MVRCIKKLERIRRNGAQGNCILVRGEPQELGGRRQKCRVNLLKAAKIVQIYGVRLRREMTVWNSMISTGFWRKLLWTGIFGEQFQWGFEKVLSR